MNLKQAIEKTITRLERLFEDNLYLAEKVNIRKTLDSCRERRKKRFRKGAPIPYLPLLRVDGTSPETVDKINLMLLNLQKEYTDQDIWETEHLFLLEYSDYYDFGLIHGPNRKGNEVAIERVRMCRQERLLI